MESNPRALFDALRRIAERPAPFETYDSPTLWTDPHISRMMLDAHLDSSSDAASFPAERIDACAAWITRHFRIRQGTRICDFGCGPGLWTSRFAEAGARVTGIDISERSIRYAEATAGARGLNVRYVLGDYLEFTTDDRFDLVTMIHGDFSVLSPEQRGRILDAFSGVLAADGRILLDVSSSDRFDTVDEEPMSCEWLPSGGFMTPHPHHHITMRLKYPRERLILEKHTVVEENRVCTTCVWDQCYSIESLTTLFASTGLRVIETYADVGGAPLRRRSDRIAVVARRAGE
ncbi:MAG: class I SAM-dependent methyltransferase [Armatimonadetes bacterium]|nr:class I SAM-dependent methyltransferase [Armatimonadota bacterium]